MILSPGFGNSGARLPDRHHRAELPGVPARARVRRLGARLPRQPVPGVRRRRSSPSMTSRSTTTRPRSRTVREMSGAESVQVMAHCIGSLTMLMSLALGLEGVRHGVASQVTLHPRAGHAQRAARRHLRRRVILQALDVDTLTTDRDDDPSWAERLYDRALQVYPSGEEDVRAAVLPPGDVHVRRGLRPRPAQRRHPRGTPRGVRRRQPDDVRADHPGSCARTTSSPPTAPTSTCRRPTTCGCRSPSCTASTTGSSSPRAAS